MKNFFIFLKSALSEPDGTGSIKRLVFLILIIAFCIIFFYCHITKTNPFEVLLQDLKTFIIYIGGLIFGGNVTNAVVAIKNGTTTTGDIPTPSTKP